MLFDLQNRLYYINREHFGYNLYPKEDMSGCLFNVYCEKNKGGYGWHYDESSNPCSDIKLTTIINLSDKKYEGGQLKFSIAAHDGEMVQGLLIEDGNLEDEVDLTLGNTTTSLITVTGGLTAAGDIESTSDIRTKENIKPIENALEIVSKIRGVTFNKKDTPRTK